MNETFIIHPTINSSESLGNGENFLNGLNTDTTSAFSALYDQYAAMLLGVIVKIVRDENEALPLLEATFRNVRSQISEFQPAKQPLFTWLLLIARNTALDTLEKRKAINQSAFQLTTSGKVTVSGSPSANMSLLTSASAQSVDLQLKELLDKVLFKNCTPEEAANSLDIPVKLARQKLRLAMQQLRSSQKIDQ
ncbi:RNA polymerase sigma factor [Spirosoma validum]|uniref:Sigma-70 family RNA polymerase sigma factor n=1 Tax=Spirosoma validum TaxID=2771355 RepID=A0A927GBS6_9BACT|nr:sigma factor [Spirosoma validum]MBD2751706.1 sigma-70 family RNA polymerase sigma factor [Spirosoma validum]